MSQDRFSLINRLRTMGSSGWNPIGNEAADRIAELERENAELRKDAERLNHVELHGCWQVTHDEWRPRTDGTNIRDKVTVIEGWIATDGANDDLIKPTLREAIDAAIASEKENERG